MKPGSFVAASLALASAAASPASAAFSGYYKLVAHHSGKAAVVSGASTSDNASIVQYTYNGTGNDEWQLTDLGNGYHKLVARHSGKAMVVASASTSNGANVIQYSFGGTATNDEWQPVDLGNGYYKILNHNSGKALTVASASTSNGAAIVQNDFGGTATNDEWQIATVGGSCSGPTCGWTQYSATYSVQKPWDRPVSDRFSYSGGIYTMWVYGNDQPFSQGSTTGPRTEVRVATWADQTRANMFEGDALLVTSQKYCMQQIKSNAGEEAVYIQVADSAYPTGTIRSGGGSNVIATPGLNTWFHLNTSFNPVSGAWKIWYNGTLKYSGTYTTAARDWYFKFGVYDNTGVQDGHLDKDQYKNVKYWTN
jgi:hypothetical protein